MEINEKLKRINVEKKGYIINIVVLICLTIYLFMFYSSTAYSAFFKNWENTTSIMEVMLDPNCIQNALHSGFIEFVFIIMVPILFMGLTYILTYDNKSKIKKLGCLPSLAIFIILFNCILSYKISGSLYQVIVVDSSKVAVPPFTFGMASNNVDFWIIIVCGVVPYIIWRIALFIFMNNNKLFIRENKNTNKK